MKFETIFCSAMSSGVTLFLMLCYDINPKSALSLFVTIALLAVVVGLSFLLGKMHK